ncbi:MAG: COX15/CtaA family protein [Candidatus Bipolaricaulota bacterium]|nr:COX15/CtaA family protein [Candidatus Bipolaricaulota bacterium]
MQTSALFRRLSFVTLLVTFGHLLFGNIVSGTDSGMGCGPHWPLCQGQLFPPLTDPALVIEWTHRLFAVLVGLSILATTLVAWRRERRFLGLATASLVLVIIVGVLGGITVLLELPKAISTAHFALGSLLFALLVVLTSLSFGPSSSMVHLDAGGGKTNGPGEAWMHRWALVSVILIYLQSVLGAYVRHSQAGLALPLWPFLTFFPNLEIGPIAHQWSHRLVALIVLGVVSLTATRAIRAGYPALGVSSLVLVLVQIALGVLTVWTLLNPLIAMLHLAGALALLGVEIVLTVRSWPRPEKLSSRAPVGEAL